MAESETKRLKLEEIPIALEILQRWFIGIKNYEEGISLLEGLAITSGGRLLAKILYKLSEPHLDLICRTSAKISAVCVKFHLKKRFYTSLLYTFGKDFNNGLNYTKFPVKMQNLPPIAMVSCGEEHIGIVTEDGDLYTGGNNQYGQTGHRYNTSDQLFERILQIPAVKMVSCGEEHTAFVTRDGDLYTFGHCYGGKLGNGIADLGSVVIKPRRIENIPPVEMVSCGAHHTAIVCENGDLYTFGNSEYGKLGNGIIDHFINVTVPQKVENLPPIKMVSCCRPHTTVVSREGELYAFGDLANMTVGTPQRINNLPPVKMVSGGSSHTAVVCENGNLYTFGDGRWGRLGDGDESVHFVENPRRVEGIPPIVFVSCGWNHTAIIDQDGALYTFGNSSYGKLGNGISSENRNFSTPQRIPNIPPVKMVSCNFSESTAFVTRSDDDLGFEKILLPCNLCIENEATYFSLEDKKAYCGCRV